jgi:selenocysteine lyase/cysteine desulfurase
MGGVAASAALDKLSAQTAVPGLVRLPDTRPAMPIAFPRKDDFSIAPGYTYINAAYTHPMPRISADAARRSAEARATLSPSPVEAQPDPKMLFARLINARPTEISYVPNTSTGENLVLNGLGITRFDGNVVTDALHFDGALVHLLALRKQGLDLRIVQPRDYRIHMDDLERVVDRKTRLIEISFVAMYNGFQHDLKAVADLAHAHDALVYVDIIQGAGAVPLDVRATGIDFAACSSFKWLMGDFGLGFLYASENALHHVERSQWGYHSTADMSEHVPPFDPLAATQPVTWTLSNDATGMFEVGSIGGTVKASLASSLGYLHDLGVENIQAYRQPMLKKLRDEMPRLGFTPVTPPESTSPIITFGMADGAAVQKKLVDAKVNARVAPHWLRVSPSVYNDMHDVDRLLEALS